MCMVSIIVPIYNVEKYLEECLDSLLRQTYKDIEIILVDDGSQDYSPEICDKYAQKDARIRVIHKQNAGVSAARNTGIDHAEGEYIMFCDSDDVAHPQWVEYHVRAINENPDSFIVSDLVKFLDNRSNYQLLKFDTYKCTFYEIFIKYLSGFPFNKIFSREIIKANHLYFDEAVPLAEDVIFNANYYRYCLGGCVFLNASLYFYRDNPKSALHSYRAEAAKFHTKAFYERARAIESEHIQEYCDEWLAGFINALHNIFDRRNTTMSWVNKIRFNQSIVSSEAFQFLINKCSSNVLPPFLMYPLKWHSYYLYFVLESLYSIKKNFKVYIVRESLTISRKQKT